MSNFSSVQIVKAVQIETPSPTNTLTPHLTKEIPQNTQDQELVHLWYDSQGDLLVETPFYHWNITSGTSITALSGDKEYEWNANSQVIAAHVIDGMFFVASTNTTTTTHIFYALSDEAIVYLERKTTDGIEGLELAFRAGDGLIRLTHRWQGTTPPTLAAPQQSPITSHTLGIKNQNGTFPSQDNQLSNGWSYLSSFDPITLQGQSFLWQINNIPAQISETSCFTEYPSTEPSVHDPCQVPNFFLPGRVLGTEYLYFYTSDSTSALKPIETAISALELTLPDLDVANIARTPRYDYDAPKNNPSPGEVVTFNGRISNRGGQATGMFAYNWYIDQALVQSGSYTNLDIGQEASLSLNWTWQAGTHTVRLELDPNNQITEVSEQNNSVEDQTNGLAVGFWVEQSVYDYFNLHQVERGLGNVSWDDYAQAQIRRWNQMMAEAIHPLTPQGIIDRVRLDKVTVVPDGTLISSNRPVLNDKTVDMMWGFIGYSFYIQNPSTQDFDPGLLHELSHARYLTDLYGLDVGFGTE